MESYVNRTSGLAVAAMTAAFLLAAGAAVAQTATPTQPQQLANNCQFGEHIDGSTMADAKRRFAAAGYSDVRDLRKGCDNVWHGISARGNVALEPGGQIFQESD